MVQTCYRESIIARLESLRREALSTKQPFKARAYQKVIDQLLGYNGTITSIDDCSGIKGIGDSIRDAIAKVMNGSCVVHDVGDDGALQDLMSVHGIGMAKAQELVKNNIRSIQDLKDNQHMLNEKQRMALKYVDDFSQRIPRSEMLCHQSYVLRMLSEFDNELIVELTGSFRRGFHDSGDIDVLITHASRKNVSVSKIADMFINSRYITDVFAKGDKKCLAACKLADTRPHRRIDLMFCPYDEFPFALLYFTGSGLFNINMRNHALTLGYTMNEHGIRHASSKQHVNKQFANERDIFEFLGMEYVEPHMRV